MRRFALASLLLLSVILIAACGSGLTESDIPTMAVLPSVTADPNAGSGGDAGGEMGGFFTPTPISSEGEATTGESAEGGEGGGEDSTAGFASPTPEIFEGGTGGGGAGLCAQEEFDALIAAADRAALLAELDTLMTDLNTNAAALENWTLDSGIGLGFDLDPADNALPSDFLTYTQESGVSVSILVSVVSAEFRQAALDCMASEDYLIDQFGAAFGSENAPVFTVDMVEVGDVGAQISIASAPSDEAGSISGMQMDALLVFVDNVYLVVLGLPGMPSVEAPAITSADLTDLAGQLVDVIRGL